VKQAGHKSQAIRGRLALIGSFLPIIALMALGYIVPVASNIIRSLEDEGGAFIGLENYASVLTSYYFIDSLLYTLRIALVSTALAMIVAVIVAMALRDTFVGKKLVVLMFQFNLTVPRMAAAMMVMLLLSQTGMLSQLAHALGFTEKASEFPWFVRDSGGIGITLAFVWKFFPYIGMSVLGILQGASREYEQQAAVLGVGRFRRFWHVTLPMIIPATSIASIIVFAAAFGDYEMPMILGGNTHRVLSVYTYLKYSDPALKDRPEAYVLMVVMSLILMVVILLYRHLTQSRQDRD
jgi:putative spermidine/putrescine transport system permease protein